MAMWPVAGTNPVNEFTTEGYISCAFPMLFPTGAADLWAPRARTVTIGNYFKHLMFQDGRFARHPRFQYFALNSRLYAIDAILHRACVAPLTRFRGSCNHSSYTRNNSPEGPFFFSTCKDSRTTIEVTYDSSFCIAWYSISIINQAQNINDKNVHDNIYN